MFPFVIASEILSDDECDDGCNCECHKREEHVHTDMGLLKLMGVSCILIGVILYVGIMMVDWELDLSGRWGIMNILMCMMVILLLIRQYLAVYEYAQKIPETPLIQSYRFSNSFVSFSSRNTGFSDALLTVKSRGSSRFLYMELRHELWLDLGAK